ncbi:MAG TPA: 4-hydroxythreonine-4-phosphate dehydrogenase PdxA [Thermoanaerobaculia bacterium]|nr:4-hydroxythreonine-4-phosphate dehydrogenase PdxA [Thermoanaerobaculia bacterium]
MKPLAITIGDPAGIGPEIVEKALAELKTPARVFGRVPANVRHGEISAEYGRVALDAIDEAITSIERGECSALVTAPIHKQSIALAGSTFPGHTELLAARAGLHRYAHDYAMYFDSPKLRVVLLTVHVPLSEAIQAINAEDIAALARLTTKEWLYEKPPRIAVAGINPHAGEGGRFGKEEEVIAQGVEQAKKEGIEVTGPHPPDTVFLSATRGRYDVVMAMYHDQGLIPVKTLDFEHSVNVTIGLPYLRVSVDHGTAFDIAGKGIADAAPMRYAIEWAERFAR